MSPPPTTTTTNVTRIAAAARPTGPRTEVRTSRDREGFILETSARYWLERAKTADIGPVSLRARTSLIRSVPGLLRRWTSAIGLMTVATSTAVAWPQEADEVTRSERIRFFGFEERTTTDWSHAFEQAPGLPRQGLFFDVATDETTRRSGDASLRFDLEGGSISYRTRRATSIQIGSDTDYRVTGWVRAKGLERSTPRLEVRVVDGYQLDLAIAAGLSEDPVAEATMALFVGEPGRFDGEWGLIDIDVDTGGPDLPEIRQPRLFISLQVVQPGFDRRAETSTSRVPRVQVTDVRGQAWFDAIAVSRVPRVRLESLVPGGIVGSDSTIPFRVEIDDPTRSDLEAELEVRDIDGVIVHRMPLEFDGVRRMEVEIEPPGVGWFSVALVPSESISRRTASVPILVLPEGRRGGARTEPRLGVSITDWRERDLDELETMLDLVEPAVVEIPVWPPRMDYRPSLEGLEPIRRLLDRQRFASREVMVAFDRLHAGLAAAARVEPESVLAALSEDPEAVWSRAVGDWMSRLGTSISRWRFASGGAPIGLPRSLRELSELHVADPRLLISRSIASSQAPTGDESYLEVEPGLTSAAIRDAVASGLSGWTVCIEPPSTAWSERDRVAAVSRRLLEAWIGGAERMLVPLDPGRGPDASLMAWTGLAPALDGRRLSGTIPVGSSTRCLVADDGRGMVLVVQSELSLGEEMVALPVGDRTVEVVDLDGSREIVHPSDGLIRISVGSLPRMIHGVDRVSSGIAASVRFEPGRLPLDRREHRLELAFENAGMESISGELRLVPPAGWTFEPPVPRFDVGPRETARIPLGIRWNGAQRLGRNTLRGRVVVDGGTRPPVPIEVDLDLESEALQVTADWSVARGGDPATAPVIVVLHIENIGDRSLDLEVDASAWRVGRESRLVTGLRPGEKETRRFRMKAGLDRLERTDIRIELRELDGPEGLVLDLPIAGGAAAGRDVSRTAVVRP